ncbi:hypothetical protein E2C01_084750 [Portunus trituberculatus]|uniref:Uncharacterized protein n=1 Tax=Portunus trituberculatus TaxID=210409 RepID=A0A5B7IZ41_PORTR|nr:hypothetical protein [Portunus trituberculatus]
MFVQGTAAQARAAESVGNCVGKKGVCVCGGGDGDGGVVVVVVVVVGGRECVGRMRCSGEQSRAAAPCGAFALCLWRVLVRCLESDAPALPPLGYCVPGRVNMAVEGDRVVMRRAL